MDVTPAGTTQSLLPAVSQLTDGNAQPSMTPGRSARELAGIKTANAPFGISPDVASFWNAEKMYVPTTHTSTGRLGATSFSSPANKAMNYPAFFHPAG